MATPSPPSAADSPGDWVFGPQSCEIIVRNAELVLTHLPFFLGGWPFRFRETPAGAASATEPDITLVALEDDDIAVDLTGPGGGRSVFDSLFTAASGLAGTLVAAYTARHDDLVCFHAGSNNIGGKLAVLIGDSGAGKSTLSLQLAATGYRLFGDDRLLIGKSDGGYDGICLGLMPKARLPLPENSSPVFREFVDGFTEMRGEETAYLKLWDSEAAVFEEPAQIGAIFVLDRSDGEGCACDALQKPELVQALLRNSYSPHLASTALVPWMMGLASVVPSYKLRYADCATAAAEIVRVMKQQEPGRETEE